MLTEFQLWVLGTVVMFAWLLSASSCLAEFGPSPQFSWALTDPITVLFEIAGP